MTKPLIIYIHDGNYCPFEFGIQKQNGGFHMDCRNYFSYIFLYECTILLDVFENYIL